MFENLTDKLQTTFRQLTGRGSLTESNIQDAMRQVRLALLEADVNYKTVKEFIDEVTVECLGEKVLKSVTPGQQAIKVVSDKLTALMGEANVGLTLKDAPAPIMMVGLHGSGKTTTTAKLANQLRKQGRHVLLVAADVYRPAAIDQLEFLGQQLGVPVFCDRTTKDVVQIANAARAHARANSLDTLILDTAGRLQIDETLVQELVRLRDAIKPNEILLIADAALGQEAVSVATHFDQALGLTGIVLTKLDGDARGGAALSMRKVTGKPIKFIGLGEKIEDLEPFHPERMASRILGMGDVVSLVEKASAAISAEDAKKLEEKMLKNQFDLNDFLNQLSQLRKLGGMSAVLDLIPGGRQLTQGMEVDEHVLKHVEAIIHSMTPYERSHPESLSQPSRRKRIASGSGRQLVEVQQLLKRFEMMRQMMSRFGKTAKMMGSGQHPGNLKPAAGNLAPRVMSQKEKKKRRKKGRR
jgi:signal recognition particle subunit SRP54